MRKLIGSTSPLILTQSSGLEYTGLTKQAISGVMSDASLKIYGSAADKQCQVFHPTLKPWLVPSSACVVGLVRLRPNISRARRATYII
jgi:hypothetical protein